MGLAQDKGWIPLRGEVSYICLTFKSLFSIKNEGIYKQKGDKMKKGWWIVGFLLVAFCICSMASCRTTKAVQLGTMTTARPPVLWDKVLVFRTPADVPGKYEEVALLESSADSMWTTKAGMWKSMKKKAGGLGCNAIILDAESEPKAGTKVLAAFLGVGAERRGKAIGIYIFPEEPSVKR
jgi:hypothetical protein